MQTRALPQGCTIVSWLLLCLSVPSPSWLATVQVFPLGLREDPGRWSLFPTNKKWGTQRWYCAREPHRVLLGFIAPICNFREQFPKYLVYVYTFHLSCSPSNRFKNSTSFAKYFVQCVHEKRCTTWELQVEFYLGQNEDCNLGGSISDSSEKVL